MVTTDFVIEELLKNSFPIHNPKDEYLLREQLRALVRLGQTEYRREIRNSVQALAGDIDPLKVNWVP